MAKTERMTKKEVRGLQFDVVACRRRDVTHEESTTLIADLLASMEDNEALREDVNRLLRKHHRINALIRDLVVDVNNMEDLGP